MDPKAYKSFEETFREATDAVSRIQAPGTIQQQISAQIQTLEQTMRRIRDEIRAAADLDQAQQVAAAKLPEIDSVYQRVSGALADAQVRNYVEDVSEKIRGAGEVATRDLERVIKEAGEKQLRFGQIRTELLDQIARAMKPKDLDDIRIKYLGRKGSLTGELRSLPAIIDLIRRQVGKEANNLKEEVDGVFDRREAILRDAEPVIEAPRVDLSLPGRRPPRGRMHPTPKVAGELIDIFRELGFQVATGPDVETEYYNFDSLNTPADHPARDSHDTFFVKPGVVLRTHTSPVQMRVMESTKPPVAIVAPGRVYRVDFDASHSPMFYQLEGLLVDEGVSFADLKGTLLHFVKRFFGPETGLRFRPHFFPFTEPSAEVDITCSVCKGSGCRVCKHSGWLEILGCGMVHPRVFEYAGYDTEKYTGYAFGFGIDRIAMLRHAIPSIHHLYENDLRFLEQL